MAHRVAGRFCIVIKPRRERMQVFKGYFTEKIYGIAPVHCAEGPISGVRSVKFIFGWNQAGREHHSFQGSV